MPGNAQDPGSRIVWSNEDVEILKTIVERTKTRSGVPLLKLLESRNPKNNVKLSM